MYLRWRLGKKKKLFQFNNSNLETFPLNCLTGGKGHEVEEDSQEENPTPPTLNHVVV